MATVLIAFVVMLLTMAGLAVGVMMGRKPIGGSCGGVTAAGGDETCACGRSGPGSCAYDPNLHEATAVPQFVDASK